MVKQLEVTLEIIFHATEDSRKIFEPIFELFQIKADEFSQEKMLGYYGNPIILAKTILTKTRAEDFVKILVSRITKSQVDDFFENIDMYIDDSSLFLRIGKNDLARNIISLQQNDAIKIRIKVPIYKKNERVKTYTELLKV
ncbi:RNA-binding protein [uncultured archaeon]|nr:RNA-binding protein [uncultured archaeon]